MKDNLKYLVGNHIKKIIALRSGSAGKSLRYISKNNLNIARLGYLLRLFPDARIVIPFRDPIQHAASLLKQHLNVIKDVKDPNTTANWVMGELSKLLNQEQLDIENCPVNATAFGELLVRIQDNTINGKTAKDILQAMWDGEGSADEIIEAKGLKQVTDTGAIEAMIQTILDANTAQVEQYRASDEDKQKKMIGFFVGQVMKASQGKANPGMVNPILVKMLKGE